jgi:hypothetical protein
LAKKLENFNLDGSDEKTNLEEVDIYSNDRVKKILSILEHDKERNKLEDKKLKENKKAEAEARSIKVYDKVDRKLSKSLNFNP